MQGEVQQKGGQPKKIRLPPCDKALLTHFNPGAQLSYALPLELLDVSPRITVTCLGEIMRGEGAELYRSGESCKYKLLYPPGFRARMQSPHQCDLHIDKGESGPIFKVGRVSARRCQAALPLRAPDRDWAEAPPPPGPLADS